MTTPKRTRHKHAVAPLPVDQETIAKAADTNAIKALVALADAFNRVALDGPFPTQLHMFVSALIGGEKKTYRRLNVGIGERFMPDKLSLGKKAGIIFSFKPQSSTLMRDGQPVEWVELNWDDVINYFGDMADKIEERLNRDRETPILVAAINKQIQEGIDKNPSMHKILSQGFALAQVHAKKNAQDDRLEEIPGFGMF